MICVLDTETTGLDPETADIVELGVVILPDLYPFRSLVKPSMPIELRAMATHHITELMVSEERDVSTVMLASPLVKATTLVAHNAGFDRGYIEKSKLLPELPWVCTWRCARQIWPEAPFHSNQVLRYWLGLDLELHTGFGMDIMKQPPHRALPDAWVTAHILKRMLVEHLIDDLIELTKQPILSTICHFGMHRGNPWEKVPKPYLRWLINKEFDADTIYTAKHFLEECTHCKNGCEKCGKTGFKYPERIENESA